MYPDAKFVYTHRPAVQWAASMNGFMKKHNGLWVGLQMAHDFGLPVPPVVRLFEAMYGPLFKMYDQLSWHAEYERHDRSVARFFAKPAMASRFLNVSITNPDRNGEGLRRLAEFLEVELPASPGPGMFPRADVFDLPLH